MLHVKPITPEKEDSGLKNDDAAWRELVRQYSAAHSQPGIKNADGNWMVGPGDYAAVVRWIQQTGTPDGHGGYVLPDSVEWNQLWVAAFSTSADESEHDEFGSLYSLDASVPHTIQLPKQQYNNALGRHPSGATLYHVQRALRLVRAVRGSLTDLEISSGRCEHHVPALALHHLRRAAGEVVRDNWLLYSIQFIVTKVISTIKPSLRTIIRRQVKEELKSSQTDDVLVAAYVQEGSYRKAADFLSKQLEAKITKDKVMRAVDRAGGMDAVLRTEDSNSVKRTAPSQHRDRLRKDASPTQPPGN